jgi:hypothetical protein
MEHSWHGIGIGDLLRELGSWVQRYDKAGIKNPHHSEEWFYLGQFQSGFLVLSGRQRIAASPYLHSVEIEFRLPGVPVDADPFQKFCKQTANHFATFDTLASTGCESVRLIPPVLVKPIAQIWSPDVGEPNVTGVVVRNPYWKNEFSRKRGREWSHLSHIGSTEFLVCFLSDWHSPSDLFEKYELIRLEGNCMGSALVFRPICTWR